LPTPRAVALRCHRRSSYCLESADCALSSRMPMLSLNAALAHHGCYQRSCHCSARRRWHSAFRRASHWLLDCRPPAHLHWLACSGLLCAMPSLSRSWLSHCTACSRFVALLNWRSQLVAVGLHARRAIRRLNLRSALSIRWPAASSTGGLSPLPSACVVCSSLSLPPVRLVLSAHARERSAWIRLTALASDRSMDDHRTTP